MPPHFTPPPSSPLPISLFSEGESHSFRRVIADASRQEMPATSRHEATLLFVERCHAPRHQLVSRGERHASSFYAFEREGRESHADTSAIVSRTGFARHLLQADFSSTLLSSFIAYRDDFHFFAACFRFRHLLPLFIYFIFAEYDY